ncbi:hypothetical protein LZ554_005216 [Drepanopeziza brunnea f. sp. 'monogermtubi']|nr:hypothetical protein LZ554_005216 [Drepanopeziza brunnea f. sp. 'monogermtubi']
MMLLSQSICSILLASSFLFSKAHGRGVIGYRVVSEETATAINERNNLRDAIFYERYTKQLGEGFLAANILADYRATPSDWYCVIEADIDMIRPLSKIWIPRGDIATNQQLWYQGEETILNYIRSVAPEMPERALRFSESSEWVEQLQILIPIETLGNENLQFWGKCWETKNEADEYTTETVDWRNWNIIGDPR